MYQITDYSYKQAQKLGVQIKPSQKKNKKIDVFKNGQLISSIGDRRYLDFPNYIETKGLEYANKRRELYKLRHKNESDKVGSPNYYSRRILWWLSKYIDSGKYLKRLLNIIYGRVENCG